MEALLKASKLKGIRRKLGYDGCFGVDPVGRIVGLKILWCTNT